MPEIVNKRLRLQLAAERFQRVKYVEEQIDRAEHVIESIETGGMTVVIKTSSGVELRPDKIAQDRMVGTLHGMITRCQDEIDEALELQ